MTISMPDAPGWLLDAPEERDRPELCPEEDRERIGTVALSAAVRTCHAIGTTLRTAYSRSGGFSEDDNTPAQQLKRWNDALDPALYWCQPIGGTSNSSQSVAILHVNILHCYAILLFTRHAFQNMIEIAHKLRSGPSYSMPELCKETEGHVKSCVEASQHILMLAQVSVRANYLPCSDPFVLYVFLPPNFIPPLRFMCICEEFKISSKVQSSSFLLWHVS